MPHSRVPARPVGLAATIAVLVWLDRSPSDVANQAALLLLLVGGLGIGILGRRRWWVAALALGASIAVARTAYLLLGVDLHDPQAPHTVAQIATLLVLVIPALATAGLGRLLRRAWASSH